MKPQIKEPLARLALLTLFAILNINCGGYATPVSHGASFVAQKVGDQTKQEESETPETPETIDAFDLDDDQLKSPTSQSTKNEPLVFRIVEESLNFPNTPDDNHDLSVETFLDQALTSIDPPPQPDQFVFLNKLPLGEDPGNPKRNPKKLFLVWNDDLEGSPISSATFIHSALQADRTPITQGTAAPNSAWQNANHNRWFIPLQGLFSSPSYPLDKVGGEDIQRIQLSLTSTNGNKKTVEVEFQITPTLPTIFENLTPFQYSSYDPRKLARLFADKNIVLLTESFTNPTGRPLKLWIRAGNNPGDIAITQRLKPTPDPECYQPTTVPLIGNVPRAESFLKFLTSTSSQREVTSMAQGQVSFVRATSKQTGKPQDIHITPFVWTTVRLEAGDTLTLDWMLGPTPGTPSCAIPGPLIGDGSFDIPLVLYPPGSNGKRQYSYKFNWNLDEAYLRAKWSREVYLSEDSTTHEFVFGFMPNGTPSQRVSRKSLQSIPLTGRQFRNSINSPVSTGNKVHSCQGVFP